jgi:hypothetical protein
MWVATADLVEGVEAAALAATSCSLHSPVERCGHNYRVVNHLITSQILFVRDVRIF